MDLKIVQKDSISFAPHNAFSNKFSFLLLLHLFSSLLRMRGTIYEVMGID